MEVHFPQTQEAQLNKLAVKTGRGTEELVQKAVAQMLEHDTRSLEAVDQGRESARHGGLLEQEEVVERIEKMFRLQETGFQNINQSGGGPGQGVFQITVSGSSGVTSSQAHDVSWASTWVAIYLSNSQGSLSGTQGLTGDSLLTAIFDSYNAGIGGVNRALSSGGTADSASTNGHYGTTALQLTKCF